MKNTLILIVFILFGYGAHSQNNITSCCGEGVVLQYMGKGNIHWQTPEGRTISKSTTQKNVLSNPFDKDITSDQPLKVEIYNITAQPILWGEQTFAFQDEPRINIDLRSLIEGKYKLVFMLEGHKSEKYFEYKLPNTLLGKD